ncbi:MAG TPA: phosphopentomutase [candidate division Zixibacteria bacterium]|nr:phosphopentomutase [candidate division Zixibacteria bacterium]
MRVVTIVLDSCGVGELPDAKAYGDEGSNTLGNLAKAVGGLRLPNLERLGLGKIIPIAGVRGDVAALGAYGKMGAVSAGKDSTNGHWELMGVAVSEPLPLFPSGFPPEIMREFERVSGLGWLGNKAASGTEIIDELGEEHVAAEKLIVYTSADSVFQIAAHEKTVPLSELYRICSEMRRVLAGPWGVGRVIARPFVGDSKENFKRTANRKDFSLPCPEENVLDLLHSSDVPTVGIGKIGDLFAERGLSKIIHTKSNRDGMEKLYEELALTRNGFIFANLVDFDTLWGHRNDAAGFAGGLLEFDRMLSGLDQRFRKEDIIFITADHGCDPTTASTNHSREYVPLLAYGANVKSDINLGTRPTMADLGATVAELFGKKWNGKGASVAQKILAQ